MPSFWTRGTRAFPVSESKFQLRAVNSLGDRKPSCVNLPSQVSNGSLMNEESAAPRERASRHSAFPRRIAIGLVPLVFYSELVSYLRNSPHNYRPIPPKNLPFPSLRRCSGHAFPKRGLTPTEEIPPLKRRLSGT